MSKINKNLAPKSEVVKESKPLTKTNNRTLASEAYGFTKTLAKNALYAGIQSPANGLAQILAPEINEALKLVNSKHSKINFEKSVQFMQPTKPEKFGTLNWYAAQMGVGLGIAGDFWTASSIFKFAKPEFLADSSTSIIGKNALLGAGYSGIFEPSNDNGNLLLDRIKQAATGSLTFGAMTAASISLNTIAASITNNALKSIMVNGMMGIASGALGGIVSANSDSLLNNGQFASAKQDAQSALAYGVAGLPLSFVGVINKTVKTTTSYDNPIANFKDTSLRAANFKDTIFHQPSVEDINHALSQAAQPTQPQTPLPPRIMELTELAKNNRLSDIKDKAELFSYRQFPDNKNIRELVRKEMLGELSDIKDKAELFSYRQFPDNEKLRELARKEILGELSDIKDKAELFSYRQFPDNKNIRELARKEMLGQISPEENEIFMEFNKQRFRERNYSRYFQDLFKRAEAKDPNVFDVVMGNGKFTIIPPHQINDIHFFTTALNGCTATVLVVPLNDGSQFVAMTHYPPIFQESNINTLKNMIAAINKPLDSNKLPGFLILEPFKYGEAGEELNPGTSKFSQKLVQEVLMQFNNKMNTHIVPYSSSDSSMGKDSGTLVVRVKPEQIPHWQTWFSSGSFK